MKEPSDTVSASPKASDFMINQNGLQSVEKMKTKMSLKLHFK
jgi:hypothetical protein